MEIKRVGRQTDRVRDYEEEDVKGVQTKRKTLKINWEAVNGLQEKKEKEGS